MPKTSASFLVVKNRSHAWAWWALMLLHAAGFLWQLHHQAYRLTDSQQYLNVAQNLHEHGEIYSAVWKQPFILEGFTLRPPVYPLFILLWQMVTGSIWGVLLAQAVLSLATLYTVQRLWLASALQRKFPVLLLVAVVLYPAQIIYANMVMSEILVQALVLGFFVVMRMYWEERQTKWVLCVALFLIAAMLTKPLFYPFTFLFLIWGIFKAVQQKKVLLLVYAILPLVVAFGYQAYNQQRTGYFHFSSIQEINLRQYNAFGVWEKEHGYAYADSALASLEAQANKQPSFAERQKFLRNASLQVLLQSPVTYAQNHLLGMVHFFLDPGRYDLVHFFGVDGKQGPGLSSHLQTEGYAGLWAYLREYNFFFLLALGTLVLANLVKLAALVLYAFNRQVALAERVLLLGIILLVAGLTGPVGVSRYTVPVFPLVLYTLPFAWQQAWRFVQNR
ncbi:hypothetical protein GU926_14840 [Nibribacter ruber]|uniref:Glycosyltransferase RgtA/B/C/D-like domain-containing protein n=1 Tax=Nibribacter ruber TaxID=2698458 RepID=A0A6P1P2M7_9BACT|nr:hypothetical protein [Nibribacter ruber]QHL88635.1 hypothetical protein GU926_14840 [Nibribacter ruber]